jgi:hypothetical protein
VTVRLTGHSAGKQQKQETARWDKPELIVAPDDANTRNGIQEKFARKERDIP